MAYEARDEELDRALAIKTIAEPNADAVVRERFRREARAAAGTNAATIQSSGYLLGKWAGL